jgi:formylglycine-generating enzyme required for sulfatase activity
MERRPLQVEGYREELGPGVALTMVKIPAGSFLMGSPANEPERLDREGPQHEVSLGAFFLAQTPITQAQWREVARLDKLEHDLKPDPSAFKGANRPVEQVSWWDAMEFCRRLSQRTGRTYSLPSESQWEYACRAGSITPFHFGATLTPELANYDGNYSYGNGPKGTYREQSTDVASFPANAWGLHDLHGTVWEWCIDHWHETYNFAPGDDQPWLIPAAVDNELRLLRGGSWNGPPRGLPLGLPRREPPGRPQPLHRFPRLLPPPGLASLPLNPLILYTGCWFMAVSRWRRRRLALHFLHALPVS